jgi:hypothetical protein
VSSPEKVVRDVRAIRHDPALGMVGVFRPLKKGPRDKLDVSTTWGGATIRWRSPDQLGVGDQSVLFAALEVALEQHRMGKALLVGAADPLWSLLDHRSHVFQAEAFRLSTSYTRLAELCGWGDGGSALGRVRASLRRLTETTVWVKHEKLEGSSRLLAWQVGNEREVGLLLNWRLTQAVQGVPYSRICMVERVRLKKSEPAQALHAVLSCKVDIGKAWEIRLDDLQPYVWGNVAACGDARDQRRKRLRAALARIDELGGWTAREEGGKVRIARGAADYRSTVIKRTRVQQKTSAARPERSEVDDSVGEGFQVVDVTALFASAATV